MARSTHFKFGSLARRYASALFDLAREDGRVDEILEELQRFQEAQDKVPPLCKSLEDKEVPHRSKRQIILEIAKVLNLSPLCQNALAYHRKGSVETFRLHCRILPKDGGGI